MGGKKPSLVEKHLTVLFATGASGGHIHPALAIAEELRTHGVRCVFVGGGQRFEEHLADTGFDFFTLPASPWNVSNPLKKLLALFHLFRAMMRAMVLIHKHKPSAVCGTGGYATVATVLAAKLSGVPTLIQEQNVLPGRANRFLAPYVDKIALGFDPLPGSLPPRLEKISVLCGNPIRQSVRDIRTKSREETGVFRLLITGGSQGARVLSDVLPEAVALLTDGQKKGMSVFHQARAEDVARVEKAYKQAGVQAVVQEYFTDLEVHIGQAHLVIARAGASTVSELAVLGRVGLFVPLRLADGHQHHNAAFLADAGAGEILCESEFTAQCVAERLSFYMKHPKTLQKMEAKALERARPDAAKAVAEVLLQLAKADVMSQGVQELSP